MRISIICILLASIILLLVFGPRATPDETVKADSVESDSKPSKATKIIPTKKATKIIPTKKATNNRKTAADKINKEDSIQNNDQASNPTEGIQYRPYPRYDAFFNGQNLTGWKTLVEGKSLPPTKYATVEKGVLTLHGKDNPDSILITNTGYRDYELSFKWRWPNEAGNARVHIHHLFEKSKTVSLSVKMGDQEAGSIVLKGIKIKIDPKRERPKNSTLIDRLAEIKEKPLGEWNEMILLARKTSLQVFINGELANQGSKITAKAGPISFQLQGADIQLRDISLKKLKLN